MSKSNDLEADFLKLLYQNIGAADIGDATGLLPSGTTGNAYVQLHTADPGETGDQTTSEASYPGYARVAVVRSSAGWSFSGTSPSQVANTATVTHPTCTAGGGLPQTITHFSTGSASSGAGKRWHSGALPTPIVVNVGVTPVAAAGAIVITED